MFKKYAEFVSCVNVQQMVTSKNDFKNEMDKMTHSVDTSQSLSQSPPVIDQCSHEQSSHSCRDGGCVGFPLPRQNWLWSPLSAQSASGRDKC